MTDVFTKAKRSEVMARIRSRGNKDTELALAKLLRAHRITGWRRHFQVRIAERGIRNISPRPAAPRGGGKFRTSHSVLRIFSVRPDFVFRQIRLALFVDGCFWHGCPRHATQPKNNAAFWQKKLSGNIERDRRVIRALRKSGWRVIRIWECALRRITTGQPVKRGEHEARLVRRIQRLLD